MEDKHHLHLPHAHTVGCFTWVWLSASSTLQSLSAMQQLLSAAYPATTLMRACKQETALREMELMVSLDAPAEIYQPSRDGTIHQLATAVLFSMAPPSPPPAPRTNTGFCCCFSYLTHKLFLLSILQGRFVTPTAR